MEYNKQRLFEVMQRVDPSFNTQQPNDNEQDIINDILSVSEGVSDWWNKFVQYGKKGLLTAAIIIAVAFSAQAQQQSSPDGVLKAGIEMSQDTQIKQDVYNFMIGAVLRANEFNMKNKKMERFKAGTDLIKYYLDLREGRTPQKLSNEADNFKTSIITTYKKGGINKDLVKTFTNNGASVTNYSASSIGL